MNVDAEGILPSYSRLGIKNVKGDVLNQIEKDNARKKVGSRTKYEKDRNLIGILTNRNGWIQSNT